ncbi:GntR family transcriptional regulator [Paenibacillus pinisoli]|uniref:GntR family transcriptional regulator n=1 Tax=Paenibacillus pinisoli TaxID=1276110 RepID=A0A3A6PA30_9BACL|nr:GntR family transcriptional regulator [Paenibacillus pinisoli]RJX37077.1 GntR family transcriptional regulator [Paenibacillus pinisoli]
MRATSLEWEAYNQIKDRIVRADVMPGMLLSENELAGELGMSRTPVRAAISLLEKEGLVESFKGRGVLVKEISFRQFSQMLEVLVSMQLFVLEAAKQRELAFDLQALHLYLQRQDASRENGDYLGYYNNSLMCIETILSAIGNDYMLQVLESYRGKFVCRMVTFRKQFPQLKPQWANVMNGKIYQALLRKDYDGAKAAIEENYKYTTEQLMLSGVI